ncbi:MULTISPECIES: hypothetical protein [Methylomonas]|jgi:hypothetical protein|uniref:Uncharacterized protein n=1 Tax=Methylomonas rosea TaxID=2952227 RepID=A0ABT1TZT0_9GAMM|nr:MULTISPECIES: hypothetical protein [Methylomonas]MCQ8119911.1 hypothetical protein [Methylomonas sp. WSC-7]
MKKSFLTSLSILAASIAADASAALPESATNQMPTLDTASVEKQTSQLPFVIDRPTVENGGVFVAAHSSHASHSSHRSHYSSR